VMFGYAITSATTSTLPSLRSSFGVAEMASIPVCLRPYNFFHPPLFI
jgi:hypothetical protein